MKVYDHISEEEPETDSTPIIWMFFGAGFIGAVVEIIKYLTQ